jgi:uncharacterized protein HemX
MDMRKFLTMTGVIAITAAALGGGIAFSVKIAGQVGTLQSQVSQLQKQDSQFQKEIRLSEDQLRQEKSVLAGFESNLSGLDASVAGLASPSDPLSAYTDICNMQATNSQLGIVQTYYYPCTNNVQLIPRPGA